MNGRFRHFVVLSLALILLSSGAIAGPKKQKAKKAVEASTEQTQDPYYNEVFNPDGSVRPKYKAALEWVMSLTPKQYKKYIRKSEELMSGDTPMAPMPRILYEEEEEYLNQGAEQRARAIVAFLQDHYWGGATYRDKVIPGKIIDEIIARSGEAPIQSRIRQMGQRPIRFLLRDDIIVNKEGKGKVLEDNVGAVGGTPGDTIPAQQVYEGMNPELKQLIGSGEEAARENLATMLDKMKASASPKIGSHPEDGVIVFLTIPTGDKEDTRLSRLLAREGVTMVSPTTKNKWLEANAEGVELVEKTSYGATIRRKVGFLWLSGEHQWIDWKSPFFREKAYAEEIQDYLAEAELKSKTREVLTKALDVDPKTGRRDEAKMKEALKYAQKKEFPWTPSVLSSKPPFPGIADAVLDGRVQSNYTAGIDFIGDKMMHTYIPDLIRYYLKEEPILENPKTERMFKLENGKIVPDEEVLKRSFQNETRKNSVLKVVDGRGGAGIHIGPKTLQEEWEELDPVVRREMTRYVVQEFQHPSVVDDGHVKRIVDIGVHAYVDESGVYVAPVKWARLTNLDGDMKMNMSQNGVLALMLRVPNCAEAEQKIGRNEGTAPAKSTERSPQND